jgi:hypothetical protein
LARLGPLGMSESCPLLRGNRTFSGWRSRPRWKPHPFPHEIQAAQLKPLRVMARALHDGTPPRSRTCFGGFSLLTDAFETRLLERAFDLGATTFALIRYRVLTVTEQDWLDRNHGHLAATIRACHRHWCYVTHHSKTTTFSWKPP